MEGGAKGEEKSYQKVYYEKKKAELIQKSVERKRQKPVATKTRAQCRKTKKGRNGKSTARVRKIRQKELEKTKKETQSRERSKRYRDKKKAAQMMVQTEETGPVVTPDMTMFKNRMAKKRVVDKTRKALLATPSKKLKL